MQEASPKLSLAILIEAVAGATRGGGSNGWLVYERAGR